MVESGGQEKKYQFLAACRELSAAVEAMREGLSFKSGLPVSFDASASGIQHLATMARDEISAPKVNLTPSGMPQDVYKLIGDHAVNCMCGEPSKRLAYMHASSDH